MYINLDCNIIINDNHYYNYLSATLHIAMIVLNNLLFLITNLRYMFSLQNNLPENMGRYN